MWFWFGNYSRGLSLEPSFTENNRSSVEFSRADFVFLSASIIPPWVVFHGHRPNHVMIFSWTKDMAVLTKLLSTLLVIDFNF